MADDRGSAAVSLSAAHQHLTAELAGTGRGALEEAGAASPADLAAALEATIPPGSLQPDRLAAAASLNAPISSSEVMAALKHIRNGAAAGLDGLGADVLKGAWHWVETGGGKRVAENVLLDSLTALLDRVFREQYPAAWNAQPATLVFKGKGAESDPDNYRPITVYCLLFVTFPVVEGQTDP